MVLVKLILVLHNIIKHYWLNYFYFQQHELILERHTNNIYIYKKSYLFFDY